MFGNANVGNLALTNLQVAGQFASDQTYVALALRAYLYFDGLNRRSNYLTVTSQLTFNLIIGDKPVFFSPCWYTPAGGGVWGFDAQAFASPTAGSVFNNGTPDQAGIMKLARPIMIPVRQNISVQATFFAVGSTSALTLLNTGNANDQKLIQYFVDGLQTRDVQ